MGPDRRNWPFRGAPGLRLPRSLAAPPDPAAAPVPTQAGAAHLAKASTSHSLLNDGNVRPWQPCVTIRM